jgi:hypothetical protein
MVKLAQSPRRTCASSYVFNSTTSTRAVVGRVIVIMAAMSGANLMGSLDR